MRVEATGMARPVPASHAKKVSIIIGTMVNEGFGFRWVTLLGPQTLRVLCFQGIVGRILGEFGGRLIPVR